MYELRFVRATARSPSSFVRPYSHRPRLVVDRIESLLRSVEDVVAAEVENGARRAREIRRAVDVHRPRERRIALACIDAGDRAVDEDVGVQLPNHSLHRRRIDDVELAMAEADRAEAFDSGAADEPRRSGDDDPHPEMLFLL